MQTRDQPDFTRTAVTLTGLVDHYNQGVEPYMMGALVPEVEGMGDFPEILGREMPLRGRDRKEGNSIEGAIGLDHGMNLNACWQQCADIGRSLGNWVRDRRHYVEPPQACAPPCAEVSWHRNCSQ